MRGNDVVDVGGDELIVQGSLGVVQLEDCLSLGARVSRRHFASAREMSNKVVAGVRDSRRDAGKR
jgi:hypothetical protein